MNTQANAVLDRISSDPKMSQPLRAELFKTIPAWQLAVEGGHWNDLREHCPNFVQPEISRRPVNGLNIEIGKPSPRCLFRPPVEHGTNLSWLLSGGSVLDYKLCEQCSCYYAGNHHDSPTESESTSQSQKVS